MTDRERSRSGARAVASRCSLATLVFFVLLAAGAGAFGAHPADSVLAPLTAVQAHGDRDPPRARRAVRVSQKGGRGGPAFCRSGEGHPVFGRSWCLEKGFGLGGTNRWELLDLGDVVLRRRSDRRFDDRSLGEEDLVEILTEDGVERVLRAAGVDDWRGKLWGRWRGDRDHRVVVLELTRGDRPIAELLDRGGDGRVDRVIASVKPH